MSEDKDLRELVKNPDIRAALEEFATTLAVNAIPKSEREDDEADRWNVYIEYRSPGKYAVKDQFVQFDADGISAPESTPTNRTEESLERFRFDLPTAVDLAYKVAEKLSMNGITPQGYVIWNKARRIHEKNIEEGKVSTHSDVRELAFLDTLETFELDEQLQRRVDGTRKYIKDHPRSK